jgi:hypothetical protein
MPGAPPFRSTRFNAVRRFSLSKIISHSSVLACSLSRARVTSALCSAPGSFTSFVCPVVLLSRVFCFPWSSLELLNAWPPSCSALPFSTAKVLPPLLTSVTSIWLLSQGYRLRPGDRSPQVRALTFPAYLPHLLLRLLVASVFVVSSQLVQSHSLMRFVFLKSQVCLRLPSDITSQ